MMTDKQQTRLWNWLRTNKRVALTSYEARVVFDYVARLSDEQKLRDGIEAAWGIIANASRGNWENETPEWATAAAKWRDENLPLASQGETTEPSKPTTRPTEGGGVWGSYVAYLDTLEARLAEAERVLRELEGYLVGLGMVADRRLADKVHAYLASQGQA
jgi:hypothetical protein